MSASSAVGDLEYVPPPNPGWRFYLFGENPADACLRAAMSKLDKVKGKLAESEQKLSESEKKLSECEQKLSEFKQTIREQEQIIAMYGEELGERGTVEQLQAAKDELREEMTEELDKARAQFALEKRALQLDNEACGKRAEKEKQLLLQTVDKLQQTNEKLEEKAALEKRLLQQANEKLEEQLAKEKRLLQQNSEESAGEKRAFKYIIEKLQQDSKKLKEQSASEQRNLQRTIKCMEAELTIRMDTLQITNEKLELVAATTRQELEATRWQLDQCQQSLQEQALAKEQALAQERQRDEISSLQQRLSRAELGRAALVSARHLDTALIKSLNDQLEQSRRECQKLQEEAQQAQQHDDDAAAASGQQQQQVVDMLKQRLARALHDLEECRSSAALAKLDSKDDDTEDNDSDDKSGEEEEADIVRNPEDDVCSLSDAVGSDYSSDAETAVEDGLSSPPLRPGTPYPCEAKISDAEV
ncbi:hypothetical protein PGQ11_014786 [Apiospora arundinis]|uniref:Uncharacterized protein n=1 Tax=Apiospora arundinis TaxID=335852 RepID=A0ABR2HTA1_9PEZI